MTSSMLHEQAATCAKPRPDLRPGYTVRVHERIQEGSKERVQIFEGLVIAVHKGMTATDSTFTVRRIASGVGVEKVFSLHSPNIEKIEVKKVAKVRRAKLFFLRGRRGKAARLSERFTTAEEFAVAAQSEPEPEVQAAEEASAPTDDAAPAEEAPQEAPEVAEKEDVAEETSPPASNESADDTAEEAKEEKNA